MSFTDLLRKNLRFVIILPLFVAAVVLVVSLFKQPLYRSSVSLLIVQNQGEQVDANAAVQSAEQMADILSRVVDSDNFRTAVLASGTVNIQLPQEPWKEAKEWRKIVKTKNITDTGILVVDVYQPTTKQATAMAASIEKVLATKGYDYLGVNPESVVIRQLNPPAPTHDKPATPNLSLNAAVGFLFGLIVAISLILLFPNANWKKITSFGGSGTGKVRYSPGHNFSHDAHDANVANGYASQGMIYSESFESSHSDNGAAVPVGWPEVEESGFAGDLVSRANSSLRRS